MPLPFHRGRSSRFKLWRDYMMPRPLPRNADRLPELILKTTMCSYRSGPRRSLSQEPLRTRKIGPSKIMCPPLSSRSWGHQGRAGYRPSPSPRQVLASLARTKDPRCSAEHPDCSAPDQVSDRMSGPILFLWSRRSSATAISYQSAHVLRVVSNDLMACFQNGPCPDHRPIKRLPRSH